MTVTPVTKSVVVVASDADTAISNAIAALATFSHIYGVGVLPISNMQWRVLVIYD